MENSNLYWMQGLNKREKKSYWKIDEIPHFLLKKMEIIFKAEW